VAASATARTRCRVQRAGGATISDPLGPHGVLADVARGSIVVEAELVAALQQGRLGGAALDVFEDEQNVPAGLPGRENVITTPQIAHATNETRRAMGDLMIDNIDVFFAGRTMPTQVV
jgi:hydroxypyruvate reductase